MPRRDSILKHFGSIKSEKRVSIKNDAPIVLEFITEKSSSSRPPIKPTATTQISNGSVVAAATSTTTAPPTSSARPASLILSKSTDQRPVFKLVRSPSIDRADSQDGCTGMVVVAMPDGHNNGDNGVASVVSPAASAASQKHSPDCCDESAPLVLRG